MNVSQAHPQAADALTCHFKVIETDPQTDPRWAALVLSHPKASIYHHPAWLEALSREYRQEALHLACESDDGQLLAVLPMIYTKGLPLNLGGPLTGRRLSSLPRTPLGGPISTDERATIAIVQEALRRVRGEPRLQLQIKAEGPDLEGVVDNIVCSPWRNSYLLELPSVSEGPFRIKDGHERTRIKWSVNRAAKLGVTVRPAETESDLREWYGLYLETMRRNTIPPRPYRLFAALWEILKPRGMMQLLIAEHQRGAKTKIVAGSIFLMFGDTVSYAFNGSDRRDLSLRPNDAIQWKAINDACANGYRRFDFGEVPENHHELAKFKAKWGASPVRMYRYHSIGPTQTESVESKSHAATMAQIVWRHLPIKATQWMGDRIYSYL
jgi:hypothetical protein